MRTIRQPISEEQSERIKALDPLRKLPLRRTILHNDGKPLVSNLSRDFPLLSRRERRQMLRNAEKLHVGLAKTTARRG